MDRVPDVRAQAFVGLPRHTTVIRPSRQIPTRNGSAVRAKNWYHYIITGIFQNVAFMEPREPPRIAPKTAAENRKNDLSIAQRELPDIAVAEIVYPALTVRAGRRVVKDKQPLGDGVPCKVWCEHREGQHIDSSGIPSDN